MRRPALHLIVPLCCLFAAGALVAPSIPARVTMPPSPPSDPGTAAPRPSPTPTDPEENEEDATLPGDEEEPENSQDSDNGEEPSPSPVNPTQFQPS